MGLWTIGNRSILKRTTVLDLRKLALVTPNLKMNDF